MKKFKPETSIAIQIWVGLIILFLIYKYIDTAIIKWPLLIMVGGTFFYSILDTFKDAYKKEMEEAIKTGIFPTKKDAIKNWSKAIFTLILLIIGLLFLFPDFLKDKGAQLVPNNHGITYEIVSKEKLDKVCVSKDKCSTTVKKIMSSNDGFLFETYISDGSDSVWCGGYNDNRFLETYNPCSTIGDYGGGGENIIVTNKKNNIKKVIVGNGTQLLRINAPEEYPYLIFSSTSEGNSKSSQPVYALYNKDDLTFVSESRENKYSVLIR